MQAEMEEGGTLFFDLFVAMCNHMVSHLVVTSHVFNTQGSSADARRRRTTSPASRDRHLRAKRDRRDDVANHQTLRTTLFTSVLLSENYVHFEASLGHVLISES